MSKINNEKKTALNLYKENKEIFKNNHLEWECFLSIDYIFGYQVSDDIYDTISCFSIDAYLHDENNISLTSISDFLATGLQKEIITLEDIRNINQWDLLSAVIECDYSFFRNEMEL